MNGKKSDVVVREIDEFYKKWLLCSGYSSEKDFDETHKFSGGFGLRKLLFEDGVEIGFFRGEKFFPIGERLVYVSGDKESLMNLHLLVLYIANKLDKRAKEVAVEFRRKESCYDTAKKFLRETYNLSM